MIEQGTPVQVPDGRIGNVVGWVNKDKVRVSLSIEKPKYEGSLRIVASIEELEFPEKDLVTDFIEIHEHGDKRTGKTWRTNQHGEVVI